MIIQQNEKYGIYIISAPDYKNVTRYLVIYGLQVDKAGSLQGAIRLFNSALEHAILCEEV